MAFLNRLLGVILGLVIAAAGVVLVLETIWAAAGQPPLLVDRQRVDRVATEQLTWDATPVTWVLVGLVLVGALLLLLQLIPRQPDTLPLADHPDRHASVERKALAAQLGEVVKEDPEVVTARAKVTRRAARVRAKAAPGADVGTLQSRLEASTGSLLSSLQLQQRLRPRVVVTRGRERGA